METEPRRHFFRLRDVLVVCVILGLLGTLAIPAIQSARSAARANQCNCKLKVLGLALQNHHDVFKRFPALTSQRNPDGSANVWATAPGATFAPDGPVPNGYTQSPASAAGYSWIVMILPYLEERDMYGSISDESQRFTYEAFSGGPSKGADAPRFCLRIGGRLQHFSTLPLDEVLCPAFSGDTISTASRGKADPPCVIPAYEQFFQGNSQPPFGVTITNYVALSATHLACMATDPALIQPGDPSVEPPNGVLVPGEGIAMKEILDGLSRTLMVSETREPAVNCWYDGTVCWTVGANPSANNNQPRRKINSPGWALPHRTTDAAGINYGPEPDRNRLFAPHGTTAAQTQPVSWGPSSQHPGNVVMHLAADGSVHSLTADIDPTLYIELITRAGREPVNMPDVTAVRQHPFPAAPTAIARFGDRR